jgi:putative hydrolase of the HAD superfamily
MSFSDKHLFFDLDRTIWDFDKNSISALKQIISEENIDELSNSFSSFHSIYKEENSKLWEAYGKGFISKEELRYGRFKNTLAKFSIHDTEIVKRFGDAYVEISPLQNQLIPGVEEAIRSLNKIGFPMHIITNGFKEVQFVKLNNCGLSSYFKEVICSEDIGVNKPNPEIFYHAHRKANTLARNSVMIGDDYHADIHGATSSGMKAIFFNPNGRNNYQHEHEVKHMDELVSKILSVI